MSRDETRLRELQDFLVSLKAEYPQLKLTKSKSADTPFPLLISISIPAPHNAARYDVSHLDIKVTVTNKVLPSPLPADAVVVSVTNQDLPQQLCSAISERLHNKWLTATTAGPNSSSRTFGIQEVLQEAEGDFLQLITLLPQCLEPYQATDASGATERRYAMVATDDVMDLTVENTSSTSKASGSSSSSSSAGAGHDWSGVQGQGSSAVSASKETTSNGCMTAAVTVPEGSDADVQSTAADAAPDNGQQKVLTAAAAAPSEQQQRQHSGLSAAAAPWNPGQSLHRQRQQQASLENLPQCAPPAAAATPAVLRTVHGVSAAAAAAAGGGGGGGGGNGGGGGGAVGVGGGEACGTAAAPSSGNSGSFRGRGRASNRRHDAGMHGHGSQIQLDSQQQQQQWQQQSHSNVLSYRRDTAAGSNAMTAATAALTGMSTAVATAAAAAEGMSGEGRGRGYRQARGERVPFQQQQKQQQQQQQYHGGRQQQQRYQWQAKQQHSESQQHQQQLARPAVEANAADTTPAHTRVNALAEAAATRALPQQPAATIQSPPTAAAAAAEAARGRGRGRGGRGGLGYAGRASAMQQQQQQQLSGHVLAQQDLAAVQRRYGHAFRFQQPPQQQQEQQQGEAPHLGTAHTAAAACTTLAAAAADGGAGSLHQDNTMDLQHFSLMLKPTDPQWGRERGALLITGVLDPKIYPGQNNAASAAAAAVVGSSLIPPASTPTSTDQPAAAARVAAGGPDTNTSASTAANPSSSSSSIDSPISLTLQPSRGVTSSEIYVLQSAIDRERQREVGRAWQLRNVLKWLENYAGSELESVMRAQLELLGIKPVVQQQQQQRQCDSALKSDLDPLRQQQRQQRRVRNRDKSKRQQQQRQSEPLQPAAASASAQQQHRKPATRDGGGGIKLIRAAQSGVVVQGQQQQQGQASQLTGEGLEAAAGVEDPNGYRQLDRGSANSGSSSSLAASDHNAGTAGCSSNSSSRGGDPTASQISQASHSEKGSSIHSESGSDIDTESGSEDSADSRSSGTESNCESSKDEIKLHGGDVGTDSRSSLGSHAITLEGLKLDNIGVLEVVQAQLQLNCDRCDARLTVTLTAEGGQLTSATPAASSSAFAAASPSTPTSGSSSSRAFAWGGRCRVCNTDLDISLRPRLVHDSSNILAGLKCVGCVPLDLLPSVYGATCGDCDAVGALRGLQVGMPATRNCSHCHRSLGCHILSVTFIPQGPPSGASGRAGSSTRGRKSNRQPKGVGGGLTEGSPLLNNGACKHYRHSYRWLRFPCCGQRFPCDICHDTAVPDGHEAAWATRMVCGYCSREQRVGKACKYCGKKLATSAAQPSGRNTRFWEGGKGCRDAKMLDHRDAHKYRNSKAKTKSAKATRVGPKPWSGGAGNTGTGSS